jgi:HTH-type transcriptional regulator / antitoxin HigA
MRDIRPIKTEADYDWALTEVAGYFEDQPALGSEEGQRFDVLADLIEAYEARVHPVGLPDPVEAIKVRLEERGLSQADLSRMLGSRSRASEILSRRRAITKDQAHTLHRELGIPAEVLIQPYELEHAA